MDSTKKFRIRSDNKLNTAGESQYWSGEYGWTDIYGADIFTEEEVKLFGMPFTGHMEEVVISRGVDWDVFDDGTYFSVQRVDEVGTLDSDFDAIPYARAAGVVCDDEGCLLDKAGRRLYSFRSSTASNWAILIENEEGIELAPFRFYPLSEGQTPDLYKVAGHLGIEAPAGLIRLPEKFPDVFA